MKEHDISRWPVPAFLLMGIGIGFLLIEEFPMAIPAFTLIGLGLGILVTFLTSRKK
ncbi:MAG: multidrug transporter [Nanoarchaeota archaeon]|nr:multidrug transporter [Nanoarchaeota archaeon]